MNTKSYFLISGTIFGIVALMHLCRLMAGWPVTLGSWQAPMWTSILGLAVASALCVWAVILASKK